VAERLVVLAEVGTMMEAGGERLPQVVAVVAESEKGRTRPLLLQPQSAFAVRRLPASAVL